MRIAKPPSVKIDQALDEKVLKDYLTEIRNRGVPYLHYQQLLYRYEN